MTAILERCESESLWGPFRNWITSTENRLYIEWFGVLMIPTLLTATSVFIIAFIAAPPVDIHGIRDPISGSLLSGSLLLRLSSLYAQGSRSDARVTLSRCRFSSLFLVYLPFPFESFLSAPVVSHHWKLRTEDPLLNRFGLMWRLFYEVG
ncbi:unnamed protein product [Lupinus luteus]|uniref:Uncharacterized protein n=1 Tax=Lupinus luteus TaxID=3873 RepID=A0AAV1YMU2_LUPLU